MSRKAALILSLVLVSFCTGLYGRKKTKTPATPAVPQMTADQKIVHALNRLTFGARDIDLEAARQVGLERWIDQQLHPETIAENPVLEAKLAPLETLRMSTEEMLRHYPSQQMVKSMSDGRMSLPEDPTARAAVKTAIERYQQKKNTNAADPASADMPPLAGQEDTGAKTAFARMTPQDRVALLQSMPEDQLLPALEALPPGMLGRLAAVAPPDLRRKVQILNTPMQMVHRDLDDGKILRAIYSNRQLNEVLADFWYNHFNVYLDKGADRVLVTAYDRDVIRPHVLGKFRDMLLATAQSPAMLFYLDNWQSVGPNARVGPNQKRRQGLNENYGRELMELHTLGVDGGYTQQDVTEVARCFTGWTIRQPQMGGAFLFNPRTHDQGEKHVLGVTIPAGGGMNDGLQVLDILAKHPSTARFISRSLAVRFVADNPPESLIAKMAETFGNSGGDLREVMRTMLAAPEFWDPTAFHAKLKSPLEMVVSAARAVDADVDNAAAIARWMEQLGEPLYRKQEPTGYSNRGSDWLNSASLLARMNFASALTQAKVPGVKVNTARFAGDPLGIEQALLLSQPSPEALAAIEAGLDEQKAQLSPGKTGPMVAALTLGSPDFQRR